MLFASARMGTFLSWYHGGGPVMLPLLLVGLAGVVLLVERAAFMMNRSRVNPRPFMEHVLTLARGQRFDDALAACAEHHAVLPDLGLILLRSRASSSEDLMHVADAALKVFVPTLRRRLAWLPMLAVIALLLGVVGIPGHGARPVAAGALVAIPLLAGYALLNHEAKLITAHLEEFAVRLINAIAGRPEVRLGHREG
jgi:biopolymer transport protein ExbB/TolQ